MTPRYDLPWSEYFDTLKPHERPMMPGSPASPDHPLGLRAAYALVGMLIILTGSLGSSAITANIQNLQGALGVSSLEAAWLPVVFVMTNACMGLILVKFRLEYGLQLFARIFLVALVAVSFANLFVESFPSALLARAASGMASAGLSTLGILYLLQAFPAAHRLKGLILGIGASSFAAPASRIFVPHLLELGGWRSFHLMELGLSLVALAAVLTLRLPPSERSRAFEPLDFLTFALFAPGMALLTAVLGLGRIVWWTQSPALGWALAASIALLGAALLIEHHRSQPLISLKWLAGPDIIRLALSILLVRVVLSEQTSGAVGFLQQMGVGPDQLHGLFWVILAATLAGALVSAFTLNMERLNLPIAIALGLIAIGAFMDSHATPLTRPAELYVSQSLLAFASALFIGPALLIGIVNVLQKGSQYVVSFLVVFIIAQNVGGLAGSALVGSVEQIRQRVHYSHLTESLTLSDPSVALRVQQLGGAYARIVPDPGQRNNEGLRLFTQQLTQQSHVLAYNDVFHGMGIAAAIGCLWVTLYHVRIRRAARRAQGPSAGQAAAAVAAID